MPQDDFQQARERYKDAREAMRENRTRMEEDLEFSNPADPQQWDKKTIGDRSGRPTLVLDNTNQFIQQVVNDGRRNTPSIQTIPENSGANVLVSQQLNGIIRHLEYASRAGTAYDTSLEYSARIGQGWIMVAPKLIDGEKNYQEPRIYGCDDPLAACLDGDSVEFDGSDAMYGFYETTLSPEAFERRWPKAQTNSFDSEGAIDWFDRKGIRVCQYWRVMLKKANQIQCQGPDGGTYTVGEKEYWDDAKKTGFKPQVVDTFMGVTRTVKHAVMSGVDFVEETDFPSKWIGLVPVYGHVLRVNGKRYICGLTRRLRDGQRFHNYQMSSLAETLLSQPKAPFMAAGRAIEGYEQHWEALNSGNPTYVPYNDIDDDGNLIAMPARLSPAQFPVAFANAANLGINEMQAAVGMYKSNLGQQSNAVSGKAKNADKAEGDNATFNFHDNQRRALEQVGRILVDMTINLIDTPRQARILGLDNQVSFVQVDPEMSGAVQQDQRGKVVAINPNVGEYGVIVKTGPSYATQREELADRLTQLGQGNPQLGAALAPLLVKMEDLPEADKVAKICLALLPTQVQQAYDEDDEQDNVPPAIKAKMMAMQQQLQQASQMIQKMGAELHAASDKNEVAQQKNEIDAKKNDDEAKAKAAELDLKWYEAQTARIAADTAAAAITPEAAAQINEIIDSHPLVQHLATVVPQLHDQMQGQMHAMANAHADLHDQVMPPDQPPDPQAQQVPQPAAPEAAF